jgi:hypothetical protein
MDMHKRDYLDESSAVIRTNGPPAYCQDAVGREQAMSLSLESSEGVPRQTALLKHHHRWQVLEVTNQLGQGLHKADRAYIQTQYRGE